MVGIWQGINASMEDQRAIANEQSIQAARKQQMEMNAFEIERQRAADAQRLSLANSLGTLANGAVPPPPGQASVPMSPPPPPQPTPFGQVPMGPQVPSAMGQGTGPPSIPPYQTLGNRPEVTSAPPPPKTPEGLDLSLMTPKQIAAFAKMDPEAFRAGVTDFQKTSAVPPPSQPQQTVAPPSMQTQQPQAQQQDPGKSWMMQTIQKYKQAGIPQSDWLALLDVEAKHMGVDHQLAVMELKGQNIAMQKAKIAFDEELKSTKAKLDEAREQLKERQEKRMEQHGLDTLAETKRHNQAMEEERKAELDAKKQAAKEKTEKSSQAQAVRQSIVKAGVENSLNRLKEIDKKFGNDTTTSSFFGQHAENPLTASLYGMGKGMQSKKQQEADAIWGSLIDEAIPVFTGGLRGSDSFRKFLINQAPQPGDKPETVAEKKRLFKQNIEGTSKAFFNKFKSDPSMQAPGETVEDMPQKATSSGWKVERVD